MQNETQKRDQSLSIRITTEAMERINLIANSKNITKTDVVESIILSQNDNGDVLDSIQWESKIIQTQLEKMQELFLSKMGGTSNNNVDVEKIISSKLNETEIFLSNKIEENKSELPKDFDKNIIEELRKENEELKRFIQKDIKFKEEKRIRDADLFLFQTALEVSMTEVQKKNIYSYKRGDVVLSTDNKLGAITKIDFDKEEITITTLPINPKSVVMTAPLDRVITKLQTIYRF